MLLLDKMQSKGHNPIHFEQKNNSDSFITRVNISKFYQRPRKSTALGELRSSVKEFLIFEKF